MLSSVDSDDELKALWNRYHVAQSVLQKQPETLQPALMRVDMSARISAALDEEDAHSAAEQQSDKDSATKDSATKDSAAKGGMGWGRQAGSLAIAASVTLFTVFGVRLYDSTTGVGNLQTPELAQHVNYSALPTANVVATSGPEIRQSTVPGQGLSIDRNSAYSTDQRLILSGNLEQAQRNQQEVQRRMDSYLLRHAENAALNNSQGMLPLARVKAFEVEAF